jgi:hypothetical protein
MSDEQFLEWEASAPGTDYKVAYSIVAGSVESGVLLSQILYWAMPSRTGRRKITIFRDNRYWIAKNKAGWMKEVGLSRKKFDAAIRLLLARELVEVATYHFKKVRCLHISLNYSKFLDLLEIALNEQDISDDE